MTEEEILARYSTPGLRKNELTRAEKKAQLLAMCWSRVRPSLQHQEKRFTAGQVEEILAELYPEEAAADIAADAEPVAAAEATSPDDGLRAAIKAAGGIELLAQALSINSSAVAQWGRVPAERIVQIERLTNLPRNVLRPDLYPQSKDDDPPGRT